MTPHHLMTLVLMHREHHRLEDHAKQLRSHTLNLNDLYVLHQHWQAHLGFFSHTPPLLSSLNRLIQQQETGNCPDDSYAHVIQQIVFYRIVTRRWVIHRFGPITPYLLPGGQLAPAYEHAFQRLFEARKPLSAIEQAALLQRLNRYPPLDNIRTALLVSHITEHSH